MKDEGTKGNGRPAVLLTRSEEDNRRLAFELRHRGVESLSRPMIEIHSFPPDLSSLPRRGSHVSVLLTSRTATRAWLELRESSPGVGELVVDNYLVVGRRSAALLLTNNPDASMPILANSVEELLEDLAELKRQARIEVSRQSTSLVYPCSRIRREEGVEGLGKMGYGVIELPVYEPRLPPRAMVDLPITLEALASDAILTFFSPSAVLNFFQIVEQRNLDRARIDTCRFAAIGTTTAEALYERGVEEVLAPRRPELQLFVEMIVEEVGRR